MSVCVVCGHWELIPTDSPPLLLPWNWRSRDPGMGGGVRWKLLGKLFSVRSQCKN